MIGLPEIKSALLLAFHFLRRTHLLDVREGVRPRTVASFLHFALAVSKERCPGAEFPGELRRLSSSAADCGPYPPTRLLHPRGALRLLLASGVLGLNSSSVNAHGPAGLGRNCGERQRAPSRVICARFVAPASELAPDWCVRARSPKGSRFVESSSPSAGSLPPGLSARYVAAAGSARVNAAATWANSVNDGVASSAGTRSSLHVS